MKLRSIQFLVVLFVSVLFLSSCGSGDSKDKGKVSASETDKKELKKDGSEANTNTASAPTSKIQFEEEVFDFGDIKEGDQVNHVFKFKNTGNSPLIIQNATAPCGCTVPEWPKDPIAPGQESEIKVSFNSAGKSGIQTKKVTITANTEPALNYVEIKTNVIKK